ncbi:MAG: putative DNA-binding domain-containing protein [Rubrivivax sp.]|nr:putative DNA-binding domain-containing protein [Rubrivivax sp.]
MNAPADREALRQQMLLRALLGDARPAVVAGWLRDGPRFERGFAAYQANAGAGAERALAAAYPTLQQLLGETSFAALARVFWRRHPATDGDIARWGSALAAFIADDEALADEPYLADVARLEWAVHEAERAADADAPQGLERLAEADPAGLRLVLVPGSALIESPHPVVTIWQAHRSEAEDRFVAVRAAFAAGQGEAAFVARQGWRTTVQALPAAEARFTAAVLARRPLAQALAAGGPDFDFEPWLIAALRRGLVAGVVDAGL